MADFVFLDPGADVTRRDIYQLGRALGMRVILVSRALTWEACLVDDWIESDPTDGDHVLSRLAIRAAPVGIVNCSESCLHTAAAIAQHYNLPGLRPDVARRCRDKVLMGECLVSAGLPMARRHVVTTLDEAIAAAREIEPPGVLKPSTGVASLYTVRFDSIGELADRYREFSSMLSRRLPESLRYMSGRWLIEEYIAGPAFSVESVVASGMVQHVAVCEKGPMTGQFFREVGHSAPARLSPARHDTLTGLTERAIRAMGIDNCVTHTEFKWPADGPRLLEIGGRMGGGSIRQVVAHATGVDLVSMVLRLAMGDNPDAAPVPGKAAASRSLYPALPGTITHLDAAQLTLRPGVTAVNCWLGKGDAYRTPPDGYGEVLGVVTEAATADDAIELAEDAISFAASTVVMAP